MSNTELQTTPSTAELATTDSLPWAFDASVPLAQLGGTIVSATTRLTNVSTSGPNQGQTVAGPAATPSGSTINVTVSGSVLSKGTWRLDVIFVTSGGASDTASLYITVPY